MVKTKFKRAVSLVMAAVLSLGVFTNIGTTAYAASGTKSDVYIMNNLEQKIIVRCKHCGWRIFDKVTMTTGVIELKCPNCHKVVEVDLSLRRGNVKYRLVRVK